MCCYFRKGRDKNERRQYAKSGAGRKRFAIQKIKEKSIVKIKSPVTLSSDSSSDYRFPPSFTTMRITFATVKESHLFHSRVMKTKLIHYLSSVHFVSEPQHVSGMFEAHHQEVYCPLKSPTRPNCCICTVYLLMMGYEHARNM